ncbi:MAG: type VI secretion system contractile sheath large subunit [Gammaproteobacteria bacterium]|nr:type VI secretion system contractile sheath large subunit [Gammaproteobacteria bacterium]MDH5653783.1 type VI secretion system contractile sheath large subunit [Gammaproteobacteria bacterium]
MSDFNKNRTSFQINMGRPRKQGESGSASVKRNDDGPFCIAILGDFSARKQQQRHEPATVGKRRMLSVDRDNLEAVMAKLDIRLRLPMGDDGQTVIDIPIRELDDFHPDQLYENLEVFARLRQLRNRLKNNNTFSAAVQEMQGWLVTEDKTPAPEVAKSAPDISSADLLDSVFDASRNRGADDSSKSGSAMIDNMVRDIMAPYVEKGPDPRQEEMLAAVDQAITAHMQFVLHHPDFQAMEAAWRQLRFLTDRIESDSQIKLYILDISRRELEEDLAQDDVSRSALYKRFADPAPGDESWDLMLGNFRFSDRIEDILTLLQLGAVARQAGTIFMAAGSETLAGCASLAATPDVDDWDYSMKPAVAEAWTMLREADEAAYLALTAPGFLLRAPYGKRSSPVDAFRFEEMPEQHCHRCYLWGNAAFLKAEQLVRAFNKKGRQMTPEEEYEVGDMPLHHYSDDGEMVTKPCAEILLTEKAGRRLLEHGLIPVWSVKNSDSIRSSDFNTLK